MTSIPFRDFFFASFRVRNCQHSRNSLVLPPKKMKKQTEIVRGASIKLRLRRKWHHGVFSFTVCVCAPDRLSQIHVPLRHNGREILCKIAFLAPREKKTAEILLRVAQDDKTEKLLQFILIWKWQVPSQLFRNFIAWFAQINKEEEEK